MYRDGKKCSDCRRPHHINLELKFNCVLSQEDVVGMKTFLKMDSVDSLKKEPLRFGIFTE